LGPDGRRYAISGEVQFDTSKVPNDPEATITKARIIKRAALAPKDPSPQDRQIAAEMSRMETEAMSERAQERREEMRAEPVNETTKKDESTIPMDESQSVDDIKRYSTDAPMGTPSALSIYV
jgi:hypothetical protein